MSDFLRTKKPSAINILEQDEDRQEWVQRESPTALAQSQREHGSSESRPGVFLACALVQGAVRVLGSILPSKMKNGFCIYPQESGTFHTMVADKEMAAYSLGSLETLPPFRATGGRVFHSFVKTLLSKMRENSDDRWWLWWGKWRSWVALRAGTACSHNKGVFESS